MYSPVKSQCFEIGTRQPLGGHVFIVEPRPGDMVTINKVFYRIIGRALGRDGIDLFLRKIGTETEVMSELSHEL